MYLVSFMMKRRWTSLLGYGLFLGMMTVGYLYNITFVQLGLEDLGTRLLGLSQSAVAGDMALLALVTCGVALAFGWLMTSRGWGRQLRVKLRIALGIVALQTLLTAGVSLVTSEGVYIAWIVLTSLSLGVGVPVTFSMTVDFIPTRDRGFAAALITAASYGAANLLFTNWEIEHFQARLLPVMLLGVVMMAVLVFARLPLVDDLARQHENPAFGRGRFVTKMKAGKPHIGWRFFAFLVLMFGVYFVDSLGFLRIIDTPYFVNGAWLSADLSVRVFLAAVHAVAALIAGTLYTNLDERSLFLWTFGIFALTHFLPTPEARLLPGETVPLATPMLYATAVSLYTVINFAIWADISTPDTIGRNAALGVALSGFTATFISTALAIRWAASDMPIQQHLRIVDSLAMLFFLVALGISLIPRAKSKSVDQPESQSP